MTALEHWKSFFNAVGITASAVESNAGLLSLDGLAGAPVFRAVETRAELDSLHTKAREKSHQLKRLLILGMPFDNPGSIACMPGDLVLPRCRVYAGHIASSFSLSGHKIENAFSQALKLEVTAVIENGPKTKTPICDWLLNIAGPSWVYGTPSSKEQLDSLIAIAAKDPAVVGHVRSRQLSFGRGCSDALLLPTADVALNTNHVSQQINQADFRFISMEHELPKTNPARHRIYTVISNAFLNAAATHVPSFAQELGCGSFVGSSSLGQFPKVAKATESKKQSRSKSKQTQDLKLNSSS